jgi:apolipoprotein N-acyltransferase
MPRFIQWYEFTGVFGGTLWILIVNVLCYQLLALALEKQFSRKFAIRVLITVVVIATPMAYSWQRFDQVNANTSQVNVLVIQQNTDTETEQDEAHAPIVRQRIAQLIETNMDSTVDLVVIPESAIIHPVCEDSLKTNPDLHLLEAIRQQFPNSSIVVGANSYREFGENPTFKENYNTAFLISSANQTGTYHKSKLVPGVERYPFAWVTRPLYQWMEGADFDPKYTPDREIQNFSLPRKGPFTVAICYESMYGDYLAQHVRKGSGFIAMITNDGWWGHSDGYRQHLAYTQLRAIETRRTIVRAANTGISAIVAPDGTLVKQTNWNKPETIRAHIPLNNLQTFYVKNGDYVLRIANFASLIFLLLLLLKWLVNKKEN